VSLARWEQSTVCAGDGCPAENLAMMSSLMALTTITIQIKASITWTPYTACLNLTTGW